MNEPPDARAIKGAPPLRGPKAQPERPEAPETEKGQPREREGQAIGHRRALHSKGRHAEVAKHKNIEPGEAHEIRAHPNPHGGPGIPSGPQCCAHDEVHREGHVER